MIAASLPRLRQLARTFTQAERDAIQAARINDLASAAAGKAFQISRQVMGGGSLAPADALLQSLLAAWPTSRLTATWRPDQDGHDNARAIVRAFDGASVSATTASNKADVRRSSATKEFSSALQAEISTLSPWSLTFRIAAAAAGIPELEIEPIAILRVAAVYLSGGDSSQMAAAARGCVR